ncbi:DUF4179 domain-containing protein [Paenibacillus sp. TRM 82003]|nr:DUF4179 domain-containing protein [Paenibacillus sp. TRM 82003]
MSEFDELDEQLKRQADAIRERALPEGADEAIRAGMRRAKAERAGGRPWRYVWRSAAAAAVFCLAFGLSIRLSPAFASTVSKLPGMDAIVRAIAHDRGLLAAVRNDFYQPIGLSETHAGVTLTVDGVIADEGRIVLFYTVEKKGWARDLHLHRPNFTLADGSDMPAGYTYFGVGDEGEADRYTSQLDVNLEEGVPLPNSFVFETGLTEGPESPLDATWRIPVAIEDLTDEARKLVYPLDREVSVEGQRIRFHSAAIYPTRIVLDVETDADNEMELFSFVDLKLVGDNGEVYTERGSWYQGGGRRLHEFEGSTFSIPESLSIQGSKLRAVPKDRLDLVLDTEKVEVVRSPNDAVRLVLAEEHKPDWMTLRLLLDGVEEGDNAAYGIVSGVFTDGSGNEYRTGNGYSYGDDGATGGRWVEFDIPAADYAQPLSFRIHNYPAYIEEPFEIRIR